MANDLMNANFQPNIPSQNTNRPMPMMPMMGQNMMQNPMSIILFNKCFGK